VLAGKKPSGGHEGDEPVHVFERRDDRVNNAHTQRTSATSHVPLALRHTVVLES
jgi:hypothetical protein